MIKIAREDYDAREDAREDYEDTQGDELEHVPMASDGDESDSNDSIPSTPHKNANTPNMNTPNTPLNHSMNRATQPRWQFFKKLLVWMIGCLVTGWIFWGSGFFTITKYTGLGLQDVQLYNLAKTNRDELLATIDLQLGESIFAVNLQATKKLIDDLPWVEQSHIVRVLPGSLHIYVTEHRPTAIWQNQGQKILVAHDGSPIGGIEKFTNYEDLPVITGERAPESFYLLQTILESYPELQQSLRGAKISRASRWSIYLDNGTLVHLPAQNIDEAFSRLRWLDKEFQVLSFKTSVIDLRTQDRAIIGNNVPAVALKQGVNASSS